MKISKIAKLCKDTKLVCMTSTEAGFWIGNGNAVYFVPEFTNMDCDGIALAFGIDEKKKEKIIFTNLDMSGFNMQDIEPSESLCEPMGINFWQEGDILRPYKTEAGVLCLVGSYLEPLRDEMEAREVYLRYTKDGKPYFAVKVGLMLYAIVMPAKGISFNLLKNSAKCMKCAKPLWSWKRKGSKRKKPKRPSKSEWRTYNDYCR